MQAREPALIGRPDATLPKSRGLSYQQLLDTDTNPVPAILRECSPRHLGSHDIPVERYTSRAFHELEVEKVWKRVWQMACREEDIPEVGDHVVYEIANLSILVDAQRARLDPRLPQRVSAPRPHPARARRQLRADPLPLPRLHLEPRREARARSPRSGTSRTSTRRSSRCPSAGSAPGAGSCSSTWTRTASRSTRFLVGLDAQFERWPLEQRYKQAHVAKIMRANWKVVQEAFSEAYHVIATHPQILAGIGDANSQYDVYENFSRAITPNGTPSRTSTWQPTEQEMFDAMIDRRDRRGAAGRDPAGHDRAPGRGRGRSRRCCATSAARSTSTGCATRSSPTASTTRCSRTSIRGARSTGSSTASARTATTTRRRSWSACTSRRTEGERPPRREDPLARRRRRLDRARPSSARSRASSTRTSFNLPKVQRGLRATQKPGRHARELPGSEDPPLPRAARALARGVAAAQTLAMIRSAKPRSASSLCCRVCVSRS